MSGRIYIYIMVEIWPIVRVRWRRWCSWTVPAKNLVRSGSGESTLMLKSVSGNSGEAIEWKRWSS